VAIAADRNVLQKEAEKKLEYNSLCIEIQRMWNTKRVIIPVISGANGIVTKGLRKKYRSDTRKTFSRFITKTAVLGTSHIIRKVLQCEA
jgi:hypothetical protein